MTGFDDVLKNDANKKTVVDESKVIEDMVDKKVARILEEKKIEDQKKVVEQRESQDEGRQNKRKRKRGLLGRYKLKVQKKADRQKKKLIRKPDGGEGFTKEEQHKIQSRFASKHKLDQKDRRRLKYKESQPDHQKLIITIFTVSIFFIFLLFQYNPGNDALTTIIILIGVTLFLPIGMIIGWMVMDPFMRCKIMRKATKKNWGVINFVAKGKKIISRIKNLDNDLIWIKNKCWAVTKEGIYELDKSGDRLVNSETKVIDADSVITITETVPVMFVDMNSMQPLTFQYEGREGISPAELGSSLKGWVDNQLAKVMFLKKTMDTYFIIVILCSLVGAYYGYANSGTIEELGLEIQTLKQMIANLQALTP